MELVNSLTKQVEQMKVLLCANLILLVLLIIAIKILIKQNKKTKEFEEEIKILEQRRENEKIIRKEVEEKKEQINTSDNNANFNNSIDILSDFARRK